ncbi:CRISPR-associated endonuclease Cas4/Cas1 [Thermopetrobacter sp. TC1]|uniref:CRISPR-associated endonuclease Cas4/Cas1 n=1 Tax=Thermopetrobacter sp. TC1 TaxID=1495045 RepID=UPI00057148D4|nr:CRISPR-associated endonuclease Cas4/Cas1 [Thermopetrobacter sp. TC1]
MPRRDSQLRLPLPAPPRAEDQPLVPVRMVNEWIYCPRLAYLMWVEGEWAETADTSAGKRAHMRADAGGGSLPAAEEVDEAGTAAEEAAHDDSDADSEKDLARKVRAVTLSSDRLGLIAKIDMVEADGKCAIPVEIKKGKRPHVAKGAYQPERVQVALQAMILEDNGYEVPEGVIWFAGSRERVKVVLDEELRAEALQAASDLRLAAMARRRPPPLENSPKCVRCALAGICLPDEVGWFKRHDPPRPFNPAADAAMPLHVVTLGSRIGKKGARLVITLPDDEEKVEVPLAAVSDVSVYGPVHISTPALTALFREDISVAWFSSGGWFLGLATGEGARPAYVREAQYRALFDDKRKLRLARGIVEAKIRNQRTILRRNWRRERGTAEKEETLQRLKRLYERARHARSMQELLGLEGEAAALYFRHFEKMLALEAAEGFTFSFATRNRRPPTDPVNALLSFGYAILVRLFTSALLKVGFDAWNGFYHTVRPGRPALALDMMEPYRPVVADSVVLMAINNCEVRPGDFIWNGPACALKTRGKKAFLAAFERRLEQETTHPVFGYQVSMRRLIDVQMRLLSRYLDGEIREYPHYCPR